MKASRDAPQIDFEQATSYRRLVARVIDLVVAAFVLLLLSGALAMGLAILVTGEPTGGAAFQSWFGWTFVILLLAYEVLLPRLTGKTLGKMLLGLRVVDARGEKLSLGRCLLRALALYVSGLVIAFLVAITASLFGWIFMRGLGKYVRFPHDAASGSYVVREIKGQLKRAEASVLPTEMAGTPFAELDRLRRQGLISEQEYQRKRNELKR
jgi:uncharacterized RDD family membrane protein YckC